MGIFDKAKDLLGDKPEIVDGAVDKAAGLVDEKTGGKFDGQINQGAEFAKDKAEEYLNADDAQ